MTNVVTAAAPSTSICANAPSVADAGKIRTGATFRLTAKAEAATADAGRIRLGATFRLV